jgi:hypothetical protein
VLNFFFFLNELLHNGLTQWKVTENMEWARILRCPRSPLQPGISLSLSLPLWTLNPLNHHHLGKPTRVLTPKAISWFIHMCPPDLSQISETLQKKLLGYWVTNISDDIKKLSSFFYWTVRGLNTSYWLIWSSSACAKCDSKNISMLNFFDIHMKKYFPEGI